MVYNRETITARMLREISNIFLYIQINMRQSRTLVNGQSKKLEQSHMEAPQAEKLTSTGKRSGTMAQKRQSDVNNAMAYFSFSLFRPLGWTKFF